MTQEEYLEYSHQTSNSANDKANADLINSKNITSSSQTSSMNSDNVSSQIESSNKLSGTEIQVQDNVLDSSLRRQSELDHITDNTCNHPQNQVLIESTEQSDMTVLPQMFNNGNVRDLQIKFGNNNNNKDANNNNNNNVNNPEKSLKNSNEINKNNKINGNKLNSNQIKGNNTKIEDNIVNFDDTEDPIARLNALRADISNALREVKAVLEQHYDPTADNNTKEDSTTKEDSVNVKFVVKKPKRVLTFDEEDVIEIEVKPTNSEENINNTLKTGNNQSSNTIESKTILLVNSNEEKSEVSTTQCPEPVSNEDSNEICNVIKKPIENNVVSNNRVSEENQSQIEKSKENNLIAQKDIIEENKSENAASNTIKSQTIEPSNELSQGKNDAAAAADIVSNKTDVTDQEVSGNFTTTSMYSKTKTNETQSSTLEKTQCLPNVTSCDKEGEGISNRNNDNTLTNQLSTSSQIVDNINLSESLINSNDKSYSENSIKVSAPSSDSPAKEMTKVPDQVKPVEPVLNVNKKELIIEENDKNVSDSHNNVPKDKIQNTKQIENDVMITNENTIDSATKVSETQNFETFSKTEIPESSSKPENQILVQSSISSVPSSENQADISIPTNEDLQKTDESVNDSSTSEKDQEAGGGDDTETSSTTEPVKSESRKSSKTSSKKRKLKKKVVIKRLRRKLSKDNTIEEKSEEPEICEKEVEPRVDGTESEGESAEPQIRLKPIIKARAYEPGDIVMYADRVRKVIKWKKATVVERITSISYKLDVEGQQKPAHISYIKKYTDKKVKFGGKEYLEIDYAPENEEEEEYNIWSRV